MDEYITELVSSSSQAGVCKASSSLDGLRRSGIKIAAQASNGRVLEVKQAGSGVGSATLTVPGSGLRRVGLLRVGRVLTRVIDRFLSGTNQIASFLSRGGRIF